jgi:protein involved in sex pheromone biosynthesis
MAKQVITSEVRAEIDRIIEKFNKENFQGRENQVFYFAEYKKNFLYLKRREYRNISPVARLTYNGDMKKWDFAIFKWTREKYDPDEFMFPGAQFADGTVEGALKAGLEAYPV